MFQLVENMVAFAYIDPGLGLLAWQAIVSAFVGSLFYFKKTRTWLFTALRRLLRLDKRAPQPAPFRPPGDALRR